MWGVSAGRPPPTHPKHTHPIPRAWDVDHSTLTPVMRGLAAAAATCTCPRRRHKHQVRLSKLCGRQGSQPGTLCKHAHCQHNGALPKHRHRQRCVWRRVQCNVVCAGCWGGPPEPTPHCAPHPPAPLRPPSHPPPRAPAVPSTYQTTVCRPCDIIAGPPALSTYAPTHPHPSHMPTPHPPPPSSTFPLSQDRSPSKTASWATCTGPAHGHSSLKWPTAGVGPCAACR
jgi:hypothetical protein